MKTIGILIPTFQGAAHLPRCLPPLLACPLKPKILLIDSSSTDGTAALAKKMGVPCIVIPRKEFNHGATREKGRHLLDTSIAIMMTQDAHATSEETIELLVEPLLKGEAALSYARQLPHPGSGFFEAFPRAFNYPRESQLRSLKDLSHLGSYTFFCSNSCAAYCSASLDEVGGFSPVLFGEDTLVAAKLLHQGHHIAYTAEATVYHSHHYTLRQEFARHFDIGLSRSLARPLLASEKEDKARGVAYARAMLTTLWEESPHLIPYALLQLGVKFTGYKFGSYSNFFRKDNNF